MALLHKLPFRLLTPTQPQLTRALWRLEFMDRGVLVQETFCFLGLPEEEAAKHDKLEVQVLGRSFRARNAIVIDPDGVCHVCWLRLCDDNPLLPPTTRRTDR